MQSDSSEMMGPITDEARRPIRNSSKSSGAQRSEGEVEFQEDEPFGGFCLLVADLEHSFRSALPRLKLAGERWNWGQSD